MFNKNYPSNFLIFPIKKNPILKINTVAGMNKNLINQKMNNTIQRNEKGIASNIPWSFIAIEWLIEKPIFSSYK